jgi:hypothetical protein
MSTAIKFEPAYSNPPPPLTNEMRIEQLKGILNSQRLNPPELPFLKQTVNLEKLISMYENGETSVGQEVFLMNGRVVTKEEMMTPKREGPCMSEV